MVQTLICLAGGEHGVGIFPCPFATYSSGEDDTTGDTHPAADFELNLNREHPNSFRSPHIPLRFPQTPGFNSAASEMHQVGWLTRPHRPRRRIVSRGAVVATRSVWCPTSCFMMAHSPACGQLRASEGLWELLYDCTRSVWEKQATAKAPIPMLFPLIRSFPTCTFSASRQRVGGA